MKHISLLCLFVTLLMACASSRRSTSASITSADAINGLDLSRLMTGGLQPIDFDTANIIYDNYRDNFKGSLEKNWISFSRNKPKAGKQSKYVWISYEEFKAFMTSLENIKEEIKQNNDLKVSGVRIYFAAYPRGEKEEDFRKKLSVILCGTYAKETPKGIQHVDIVGKNKASRKELAAYHNHGHLCPPDQCEGALLDDR